MQQREQINALKNQLHHEAEPKIQSLEKEINDLLSDLNTISNEVETLKSENEMMDQKLSSQISESEEIIEVKDTQIRKLQEVNKRLSLSIEEYETREKAKIKELQEEHLKLQVDFEKVLNELENKKDEDNMKEWYLNELNQQLYLTLEEKTRQVDELSHDIDNFKNSYEMYEREKHKKESLRKKLNKCRKEMEEFDKENSHANLEKDQAILKIKNSFMCKLSF